MNREKQIEEMAKVLCEHCKELWGEDSCPRLPLSNEEYFDKECFDKECFEYRLEQVEKFYKEGYRKINDNEVVISKEEYDELINLQLTHAEDLTNAIQSYEEKKADLKLEYNNHIKNLEKIIDRQNKNLNSQADRLIDLKEQLKEMEEQRDEQAYITEDLIQEKHRWTEQARKETAREIFQDLYEKASSNVSGKVKLTKEQIEQLAEKYGV